MMFKRSARVLATRVGVLAAVLAMTPTIAAPGLQTGADSELKSAVRQAWRQHPAADATEATLAAARAGADAAAQPLYNPEAEFAFDNEGDRTATLGLSLTLDMSGKRTARAASGLAELNLAQAQARMRRTAFAKQWLLGWTAYRTASRKVVQGQQRVDLMERFAQLAEKQLQVSEISTLERDLALLARDEAQADQATLESDAAMALESFKAVGGTPAVVDGEMAPTPPSLPQVDAWRPERLPEAIVALANTESAEQRIVVAERDRRADPTLGVYAGRIDFGPTSDTAFGLTLSVPLLVRNRFRSEVSAARADADSAAAEQRLVLVELGARAERAVTTYESLGRAWARWSNSSGTDAGSRADLLERLWRAGEMSTADYLIQLKQTLDTALAGADLQGRLWASFVEALVANGSLESWIGFDSTDSEVTQ